MLFWSLGYLLMKCWSYYQRWLACVFLGRLVHTLMGYQFCHVQPLWELQFYLVNLFISSYFLSIKPLECTGIFDFPTEYIDPSLIFIEGFLNLRRFKTTESLSLKIWSTAGSRLRCRVLSLPRSPNFIFPRQINQIPGTNTLCKLGKQPFLVFLCILFKPKLLQGKTKRLCYITSTPYFDTKDVASPLIYVYII